MVWVWIEKNRISAVVVFKHDGHSKSNFKICQGNSAEALVFSDTYQTPFDLKSCDLK